jgi:hypothetical protein
MKVDKDDKYPNQVRRHSFRRRLLPLALVWFQVVTDAQGLGSSDKTKCTARGPATYSTAKQPTYQ